MTFVYVRVPPMQGSKRAVAAPLLPQPVMRHIDIYKCTCSYILKINIYMYKYLHVGKELQRGPDSLLKYHQCDSSNLMIAI